MLLTCNTGAKLYPNKYAQTLFRVDSKAGNVLKVFIGKSFYDSPGAGGYNGFDGFHVTEDYNANTGTLKKVTDNVANTVNIAGWVYDGVSGVATVTFASDITWMLEGSRVRMGAAVTLNGSGKTSYPEAFDAVTFQVAVMFDGAVEIPVGKFVKFAPLIAGKAPDNCPAGRLVKLAPLPENTVADNVPLFGL